MRGRPPLDDLWREIAARIIFSNLLRNDATAGEARDMVDDLYFVATEHDNRLPKPEKETEQPVPPPPS